jgi:hypothetical protein
MARHGEPTGQSLREVHAATTNALRTRRSHRVLVDEAYLMRDVIIARRSVRTTSSTLASRAWPAPSPLIELTLPATQRGLVERGRNAP